MPRGASDPASELLALTKLIQEYNTTDNPGKYVLRADSGGQFAVVGTAVRDETGAIQEITPLLDTPVNLVKAPHSVYDTIKSILGALQYATGKQVLLATASSSLLRMTQATVGGEAIPARDLLKQALASTKQPILYDLFFNPDVPIYILNLSPTMQEADDGLARRKLTPAGPPVKP
jgi:hypothetical protein